MAYPKLGVQSALRDRLKSIGRSANALRARIEQGFRRGPANDDDHDPASAARSAVRAPVSRRAKAPDGLCIYAIGDIHGRRDLLERLVQLIAEDAANLPDGFKPQIIFLGDYIDRGLQSRDVINFFTSGAADAFNPVYLMGNHEEALLRFMREASFGSQWARYGGAETLYSYGLQPPNQRASLNSHDEMQAARNAWTKVWNEFQVKLPPEHLAFFQSLKPYHVAEDYLFVHAGLRPGVELEEQTVRDMLWIREEFLDDAAPFAQMVVHGHTPMDTVHHDERRIGLDTGAFLTGKLTAARLIGTDVAFLST
ncbi:metallophosphoesterase family protein [Hyphomonas sp.]|uniref:metallophosphoesterase family protein n=1 Tax=Hyphomonas sp. TaxID=87 RepID=UPI001DBC0AFB|nr:metallophosphoesterase family protein [Hyphomonas sp.]MBU4061331.1 serine/threonine protein phosphatase [Alphaproteobacteria bacterium]